MCVIAIRSFFDFFSLVNLAWTSTWQLHSFLSLACLAIKTGGICGHHMKLPGKVPSSGENGPTIGLCTTESALGRYVNFYFQIKTWLRTSTTLKMVLCWQQFVVAVHLHFGLRLFQLRIRSNFLKCTLHTNDFNCIKWNSRTITYVY